jgi:hypothetical protein
MEMRDIPRNVPNEVNCWLEINRSILKKKVHVELYPKNSHLAPLSSNTSLAKKIQPHNFGMVSLETLFNRK